MAQEQEVELNDLTIEIEVDEETCTYAIKEIKENNINNTKTKPLILRNNEQKNKVSEVQTKAVLLNNEQKQKVSKVPKTKTEFIIVDNNVKDAKPEVIIDNSADKDKKSLTNLGKKHKRIWEVHEKKYNSQSYPFKRKSAKNKLIIDTYTMLSGIDIKEQLLHTENILSEKELAPFSKQEMKRLNTGITKIFAFPTHTNMSSQLVNCYTRNCTSTTIKKPNIETKLQPISPTIITDENKNKEKRSSPSKITTENKNKSKISAKLNKKSKLTNKTEDVVIDLCKDKDIQKLGSDLKKKIMAITTKNNVTICKRKR